ncbi:MAG: hypothetical protein HY528_03270, partial [Chloroflexi bacterium]|nr:hypothetical protein [Chloroflexota bacterium]
MLENEVKNLESTGETTASEEPAAEKTAKKAKPASATASKKTEKAASIDEVIASIKSMTVLDLAELVKTLET